MREKMVKALFGCAFFAMGISACGGVQIQKEQGQVEESWLESVEEKDYVNAPTVELELSEYSDADFAKAVGVEFATEYDVIDKEMDRIFYMIRNHTGEALEFGEEYVLEVKQGEKWYRIPFPENAGFDAILYRVEDGNVFGDCILFDWMDYDFADGEYRIVKQIGEHLLKAEFSMGESAITPRTPFGYKPLSELPKKYTLEAAIANRDVVMLHDKVYNAEQLQTFVEKTRLGFPAMVRILLYTVEGDPVIHDVIRNVSDLGNEWYEVIMDGSRDAFAGPDVEGIRRYLYSYAVTDGHNLYLSNYADYQDTEAFYEESLGVLYEPVLNEPALKELGGYTDVYKQLIELVQEMTETRLAGNVTRLKVYNETGEWYVSLNEEQMQSGKSFCYGGEGFGNEYTIPDSEGKIKVIAGFEWLNENEVQIICKDMEDKLLYYTFSPKK